MVGNNKSGVRHIMIHSVEELQGVSQDGNEEEGRSGLADL